MQCWRAGAGIRNFLEVDGDNKCIKKLALGTMIVYKFEGNFFYKTKSMVSKYEFRNIQTIFYVFNVFLLIRK